MASVRAIKTEMTSQELRVRVELKEIHEFSIRHRSTKSKTSRSTKENDEPKDGKGGKNTQDGKGKDHQSSPPSRQTPLQTKSIRSDHCLHPRLRQPQGRGRAAMAAFPDPNGCATLRKITGGDRVSFSWKGYLKRGRTDYVARGLNLEEKKGWKGAWEEKRCGLVDGLWKGGAPPWPLSLPLKLSILCQDEPEGTGWGRVNPRRKAHRNGRCLFEG